MTSQTNNVVVFPKTNSRNPLQSIDEIHDHIAKNREEHITYLIEDISDYVIQRAELEGFRVSSNEHTKSTMLFIESMRAMFYKTARLNHPLHKITDEVITIENEEEKEED